LPACHHHPAYLIDPVVISFFLVAKPVPPSEKKRHKDLTLPLFFCAERC
jgi:hypothetical protein